MIRELLRAWKYLLAGSAIQAFITAFRMASGAEVNAGSLLIAGTIFVIIVIVISAWQIGYSQTRN